MKNNVKNALTALSMLASLATFQESKCPPKQAVSKTAGQAVDKFLASESFRRLTKGKKASESTQDPQCTFRPELNPRSRQLAERKTRRLVEQ